MVFLAHVVGELPCGSQPTAPTCVVWSWRLIDGFALISASRGLEMLVYPVHYCNSFSTLVTTIGAKQLSVSAPACVLWQGTFVRWPGRGLVYVCLSL